VHTPFFNLKPVAVWVTVWADVAGVGGITPVQALSVLWAGGGGHTAAPEDVNEQGAVVALITGQSESKLHVCSEIEQNEDWMQVSCKLTVQLPAFPGVAGLAGITTGWLVTVAGQRELARAWGGSPSQSKPAKKLKITPFRTSDVPVRISPPLIASSNGSSPSGS
jgi:hypothetical protein